MAPGPISRIPTHMAPSTCTSWNGFTAGTRFTSVIFPLQPGYCIVERLDQRAEHLRPHDGVRRDRAQHDTASAGAAVEVQRTVGQGGRHVHAVPGHGDALDGDVVAAGVPRVREEQRVRDGARVLDEAPRLRPQVHRRVAERGEGWEAQREPATEAALRCELRWQRERVPGESRDAGGRRGERRQEAAGCARTDGGERLRVQQVGAVGGVGRHGEAGEVAGDRVEGVGGAGAAPGRQLAAGPERAGVHVPAPSRALLVGRAARVGLARDRGVRGGARRPDERAREVDEQRRVVLDGDGVEGGGGVFGDPGNQRRLLARLRRRALEEEHNQ
ncbi:hypothetical protein SETIT_5G451700v2 [Setaria italica]|uniref:Uncharacterized protein n=1 Tax=Setaria italica TaxID=4555 RepID=A0A368RFR2_SETIT|nr:hypothetical protein SETIT_5G451700v2 [Setaria italica]